MNWAAVGLSLRLAIATTIILLFMGAPLAYWLATTRSRLKFLIDAIATLPIVLPPTVVGFYLLVALGPRSPLGKLIQTIFGETIPFTFTGILIGSIVFNVPFAVRPLTAAFQSVERRLIEASWCLGVSRFSTFFRIILPLAWPGVLTAIVLVFTHTIGEFGVVLMLGGNIPGVTQTISIVIYDNVQALDYTQAHKTAGMLLAFSFLALCAVWSLQRKPLPL